MRQIIDLTHTICEEMPVYPGTEPPVIESPWSVEKDGFVEQKLSFYAHIGTHIDAPAHMLPHAPTLDRMPVDAFIGQASVIRLPLVKGSSIDLSDLKSFEGLFKNSDFILLHTGWSKYWGQDQYFHGYPVLSEEAALWIHSFNLKGVGADLISLDAVETKNYSNHKTLLERGILIENLTNLEQLPETGFLFSCLPLKVVKGDGSPVRAVAIIGT